MKDSAHLRVYSGIAWKPASPFADLSGLFRVVVLAKSHHHAKTQLEKVGIKRAAFLEPTLSIVERNAAQAGKVMACGLVCCYVRTQYYEQYYLPSKKRKRKPKEMK